MEDRIDATSEPRKEWVAPELMKVDIEDITALGTSGSDDMGALS
jgi:hypothetical protein